MISVLLPVYNTRYSYLDECLDSCLSQTFKKYEIVVINNGSTSLETLECLNKYKKFYKLFNCEQQKNKNNLSVALNYGLQFCNYNLIARMDSDDIMTVDRLEKQYSYMVKNDHVDILGGQIEIINSKLTSNHPCIVDNEYAIKNNWFINHPTVIFKKDKIHNIGGYLEECITKEHFPEDLELWLRSLKNNLVIHNLQDIILYYRRHDESLTSKNEPKIEYAISKQIFKNKFMENL
jgi:glycosyltransferase involved in cell wall biosynthesis